MAMCYIALGNGAFAPFFVANKLKMNGRKPLKTKEAGHTPPPKRLTNYKPL